MHNPKVQNAFTGLYSLPIAYCRHTGLMHSILRPRVVENMLGSDQFVRVWLLDTPIPLLSSHHLQATLELVDVDVAALQVAPPAVQLKPATGVKDPSVVEADEVAGHEAGLQSSRRAVDQPGEDAVCGVVSVDVGLVDVQWSLECRRPTNADDLTSFRIDSYVRVSISVRRNKITAKISLVSQVLNV